LATGSSSASAVSRDPNREHTADERTGSVAGLDDHANRSLQPRRSAQLENAVRTGQELTPWNSERRDHAAAAAEQDAKRARPDRLDDVSAVSHGDGKASTAHLYAGRLQSVHDGAGYANDDDDAEPQAHAYTFRPPRVRRQQHERLVISRVRPRIHRRRDGERHRTPRAERDTAGSDRDSGARVSLDDVRPAAQVEGETGRCRLDDDRRSPAVRDAEGPARGARQLDAGGRSGERHGWRRRGHRPITEKVIVAV
jgi:hypothetical protein